MSVLVSIAERAETTVEDVVRVLTREPVGDVVRERVLAVLDELGGDDARIVERFALAAVHDALPPPDRGHELAAVDQDAGADVSATAENGALTTQVGELLEELVVAVKEIRQEGLADRRERLDDLAVLVELLTTGWRRLDRRLGRVERLVERLEADRPIAGDRPGSDVPSAENVRVVPIPVGPARLEAAPIEAAPIEAAPIEIGPVQSKRGWLPGTILVLLAGAVFVILAFDLIPSSSDDSSSRTEVAPTPSASPSPPTRSSSTTTATAPPSTARPRPAPPQRSTPRRSTPTASTPRVAPAPARTTTSPPRPPAPTVVPRTSPALRPRPTQTAPSAPTGAAAIRPARNFVWAPVARATYYSIRFFRDGELIYQAQTTKPGIIVPERIVFRPGLYRWVVRPGFGAQAAQRVGAPVVDSRFSVAR